jgi:probable O-glycosylation ligase (exosortase A-associated)
VTSQKKFKNLVIVTAMSFGVLAIKGAIFGIRTSGESRVWGPPDSFISDNNAFGLAVNMSLPMLIFLARDEKRRFYRWCYYLAFACGVLSVILTYSRGGLLGLTAVLFVLTLKSKYKVISAFVAVLAVGTVITFAPPQWMSRMSGLAHGDVDASGKQRLVAWGTAWNFAMDYPITGGSFNALPNVQLFQHYQPEPLPLGFLSTAPHSIYFQTLEEQGFVGLALYLTLVASCFMSLSSLRRKAVLADSTRPYTQMIQVSLLAFLTSGAFLGLANFDLFYQLVAMTIVLKILSRPEALPVPRPVEEAHAVELVEEEAIPLGVGNQSESLP